MNNLDKGRFYAQLNPKTATNSCKRDFNSTGNPAIYEEVEKCEDPAMASDMETSKRLNLG